MGKHFLIFHKILKQSLFIVLLCFAGKAKSQVSGDYRSKDPQSGSSPYYWETTANWETYNGSSWITAIAPPTASNNVTIQTNDAISISSTTAACNSFTTNGTLTFYNSSSILTVSGDFTNNGTFTRGLGTIVLNGIGRNISGVTTFGNLTISGSYTLQDNIAIAGSSTHTAIFTNNGTFTANDKTVTLGSSGSAFDQIIAGSSTTTFYKLEIVTGSASAANTCTLNSDIIISNNLLLNYSSGNIGGVLINGTHLTMASGSSIKRHGGSITNTPTFAGYVDIYYGYSSLTTGPELPSATSSALRTLEIYYSAALTLNSDVNASGNIYISSGSLNANNGSNNYNITFGGNWTNSGTFTSGSNNVTLNGTASQNITSGNGNFYNFTINKNSNSATLLDNCTISNTLTLTKGIINTGSNYLICTRTDMTSNVCNSISCSNFQTNNVSYINGNLRQYVAASGANEGYYLPVGSSSVYRLAKFISPAIAVSGVSYVDAYFMPSFSNTGNLNPTKAKDYSTIYSSVCNNGIWHIQGDANPTGNTKYNVMLFFDGGTSNGNDFNLLDNSFEILKRTSGSTSAADWEGDVNGSTIPANDAAGRKVSDGYVIRNNFNSFSEFGIAKADEPLPVCILTFDAKFKNDIIDISWSTASEINSDYFIVQRTVDMNEITDFQKIKAAGTSNSIINYQTIDENPLKEIDYYRLKEIDFNGETTYSKWIAVNCNSSKNNINISPNPAKDIINIELNNNFTSDIKLEVLDITGKKVKYISSNLNCIGNNIYQLNIDQFKNGIYFIHVISAEYIISKIFVKAD